MRILVCVKHVPRPDGVRFQPGLNRIVRDGVPSLLNPCDAGALGHALALRAHRRAEVVAATMGPPGAAEVLDDALRYGADRAVHLCDPCFAGADTLATARALARLVARERPELVLLGRSTLDGGTAQVGPQLAELAGLPQVTHAVEIRWAGDRLAVVRESEHGLENWTVEPPALVTAERGPLPAPGGPVAGRPVALSAAELGGDPAGYGIRGSATYVSGVVESPVDRRGERVADLAAAAARIAELAAATGTIVRPEAAAPVVRSGAGADREIWVVAEPYGTGLHPVGAQGLAAAHAVAGRLGARVVGVLAGAAPDPAAVAELAAYGAERVLCVRHPLLTDHRPEVHAHAIGRLIAARAPVAVIGPWTARGRDWLPRATARLGIGTTGDVVGLDVQRRPGDPGVLDLVWLKPAWSGTALARVVARTVPSAGTLRPGAVAAAEPRRGARVEAEEVPAGQLGLDPDPAGRGVGLVSAVPDGVDPAGGTGLLDAAPILVCLGGRVLPGTARAAHELAAARGWAVVGTPAAVAAGLVLPAAELSMTKRSLAPALVVALGVTEPAELDPVRGAGTLVTVAPQDAAAHAAADIAVPADPDRLVRALESEGGAAAGR